MTHGIVKRLYLVIVVLACLVSSCWTNDGDIGFFYGQWALKSMTVNSEDAGIDVRDYFWKFENNIIEIQKILEMHSYVASLGTWEEKDNVLWLNFTHEEGIEGGQYLDRYNPPPELGIPGREISPLVIEKLTGKDMELSYTDAKGRVYRYKFRKLL